MADADAAVVPVTPRWVCLSHGPTNNVIGLNREVHCLACLVALADGILTPVKPLPAPPVGPEVA